MSIEDLAAWATLITGVGTGALAGATYWMARRTSDLAKGAQEELQLLRDQTGATRRQGEVAERALTSSIRPLLADVPRGALMQFMDLGSVVARDISEVDAGILDDDSGNMAWLTLPVRNIGTGAARCLTAVAAFAAKDSVGGPVEVGRVPPVVPVSEHAVVGGFQDTPGLRALIASQEEIVIEIAYEDVAGDQLQATSIFFVPRTRIPIRRVAPGHEPELTIPQLREMGIDR